MLQSVIHAFYPPQCSICDVRIDQSFSFCGPCWAEAPFIEGACCNACGTPLLGLDADSIDILCDDCMKFRRPWSKGRAVFVYSGSARRLVLSLKHGDRTDLPRVVGPWMAKVAAEFAHENTLILPVPLHRSRLLKRRYNQAALLGGQLAKDLGVDFLADGLLRTRKTKSLEGQTRNQRFETLNNAICVHSKKARHMVGKKILLVDDVMTSGATFAAATDACFSAGAHDVSVLALARAVKDA